MPPSRPPTIEPTGSRVWSNDGPAPLVGPLTNTVVVNVAVPDGVAEAGGMLTKPAAPFSKRS